VFAILSINKLTLAAATDGSSTTKTSCAKKSLFSFLKFVSLLFLSGVDEASVFLGYDAASLCNLTFLPLKICDYVVSKCWGPITEERSVISQKNG
jgi:hypothetical protein